MQIPIGHFAADFFLLAWGWFTARAPPRRDLLVHHALGLVAALLTLAYPIAAPLYLVLFTTELMPITTALSAPARSGAGLGSNRWARACGSWCCSPGASRSGSGWAGRILRAARAGGLSHDARIVYLFSASFLVVTLGLDAFWTWLSLQALRRAARTAPRARA